MRTPEISGSWAGEFAGTLQGSITLELKQTGSHIIGVARMHEPSLGRLAYDVKGDGNEGDRFQMTLSRKHGAIPFGTIHTLCWLEANDSLTGRWQSDDGKKGAFTATRLAPFAPPKTPSPPPPAAPRVRPTLPPTSSEKPGKPPATRLPGKPPIASRKPIVLICGNDKSTRQTVSIYLKKIGAVPTSIEEHAATNLAPIADAFENIAAHAGFAVVLMTPDDVAYPTGKSEEKKKRPSQNSVWQLGYLTGKLGRKKLLVLTQGDLDTPADVLGLGYEPVDRGEGWKLRLARELKSAGFPIDLNGAL